MPEGHVTHRLARELTRTFGERPLTVASPQGRFADSAAQLDGGSLVGADAVGKHLLIDFDPGTVWVHLGLIGKFQFNQSFPAPNPATLRLRLTDGASAADLRGPQWCRLITPVERAAVVANSGPDPIRGDADPERAWAKVSRSRKPFAALLMDQSVFAGVGNIFRAEVLFRHAIDPMLPAQRLSRSVFDAVWDDLVILMRAAVEVGRIDTVAGDHTPEAMGRDPRVDRHGGEVYVYRRAGLPCYVCGTPVATTALAGRHLYWCPTCQPAGARGVPTAIGGLPEAIA
ncbi:Fpg/Nei family DNA glycosylase [Propioniciclava coleopterorum]|uniref:DNA-(apurinic or apyrimidinic site) lyase n=1 Tax=Propioniciclava coleopterorum TaxID=2714937 RepID=A0A6G7Y2X4_9ACTN|nr:Fpg/Nei family DNA glycosylase [Propioniciclava coleopterorum]QIK71165.1 Fpg/Nei family DNA glycosylase [Propioniciclava coleopterorum]